MTNQHSDPRSNRVNSRRARNEVNGKPAFDHPRALHRISAVRQQEGVSLRQVRSILKIGLPELRRQEARTTDLRLTDLYRWQHALKVPVTELLQEPPDLLSPSLRERTKMVRAMKTALSLVNRCEDPEVKQLAERLVAELNEVIPGLDSVGAWPLVQQRHGKDFGRALEYIISTHLIDEQT